MTQRDQHAEPVGDDGGMPAGTAQRPGYRPELQGLRALAVLLVVVYHVWVGRVSGGVDVFFVVTGFLLTGQLVRAAERGAVDVRGRWARSLRRLTPAAAVVLVSSALLAAWLLPAGRWSQTVREIVAAALYLENWQLAADAVDYAARNNVTSVVQHFWSLSIQGQVFLVWPLLIAVVALACRTAPGGVRRGATLALLGLFAASLLYSVGLTLTDQPLAYFHTFTRLWEFAMGGRLALHIDRIRLTGRERVAAGWTGVLGLVACGAVIPVATAFPGFAALWPTGCAVLVLLAGRTGARVGADRILAGRAARYLGDLSYALYLWHWPLLVLYLQASGEPAADLASGALVIVCALGLAVLTYELVERPLSRRAARRSAAPDRRTVRRDLRVAAIGTVTVLVVAAGWQVAGVLRTDPEAALGDDRHPGAVALRSGEPIEPAPLLPSPTTVTDDWVRIEQWNCTPMTEFPQDYCAQPPRAPADQPDQPNPPSRRIVVVGDSHAQQLTGALIPLAERHNWQLIVMARGACPFSTVSEVNPDDEECLAWNAAVDAEIALLRPDAVVSLASRDVRAGLTEQTPDGFVEQWRRLDALGIPVVAIRDNPRFDHSIPDCVQTHPDNLASCGAERAAIYHPEPPWAQRTDLPGNVSFVDIADAVCTPDHCPPVIGNVLVYLDDNHLTATYALSMADLLADQVGSAFGWDG